ncbi:MAG: hypothetical protein CNLJKLNK_01430 [Holosporales bacterium]
MGIVPFPESFKEVLSITRYYISAMVMTYQKLNDVARAHCGIENQLHRVLDVSFNEDKSCICDHNAAENLTTLRKWSVAYFFDTLFILFVL